MSGRCGVGGKDAVDRPGLCDEGDDAHGRIATPQEVAGMIALFASQESSGVSGEAIRVADCRVAGGGMFESAGPRPDADAFVHIQICAASLRRHALRSEAAGWARVPDEGPGPA